MGPDKGNLHGKVMMMVTKAKAQSETKNNQEKNKAWISPDSMQDLAVLLDEDQPKGKGGGNREDPTHAMMEEIRGPTAQREAGLLAGNGDLIRRWLL